MARKTKEKQPEQKTITVNVNRDVLDRKSRKWPLAEAIKLRLENGLTLQQIADHYGVTKNAIWEGFRSAGLGDMEGLTEFKANRGDVLADIQKRVLAALDDDKLKSASARDLATLFGILYDKERLERGQSTQNTSVFQHVIEQACD